jgi:cell division septation protein DedD
MSKSKDFWFVGILVGIAVVLAFFAFSRQPERVLSGPAGEQALVKPGQAPEQTATQDTKTFPTMLTPLHEVESRKTFSIQVYSFKEKERAETALKALKDKNYPAFIMVSDIGDRGIWYRVRVGSFTDENEAKRILDLLVQDFKNGIIVSE